MSGINNIYILNPIVVAKLLQCSGSRVEHSDGFSSYKRFIVKSKTVNLVCISGFNKNRGVLVEIGRVGCVQIEIKMNKNKKKKSLKHHATRFKILRQIRGSRVLFLALGRMTYSHFPNRIFIWIFKTKP